MRKSLYYSLITLLCAGFFYSCSDDDNSTPVIGIKEVKITPADEAIAVSMYGRYNTFTLENTDDSIDVDVPKEALKNAQMEVITTVAANIQAFCNGELINGPVTVDATQPINVEVRGYNQSHTYTIKVVQATTIASGDEPRLKSTDMRKMGINPSTYDFDVAVFNDKFYAITAAQNGDLAEYQLYESENGIKWNEIEYKCVDSNKSPCCIGGRGARLAVMNNRMYILGGARHDGTDKYGNEPEMEFGMFKTISYWRSFSTEDGINFKVDTIGIQYEMQGTKRVQKSPGPTHYANVTTFNNQIYYRKTFDYIFYQYMFAQGDPLYTTIDGTNWNIVNTDKTKEIQHCAFFTFKNKLWILGGYKTSINKNNIQSAIYSSTDGISWKLETEESSFGKLAGMTVAVTEDVAYIFGGEYYDTEGTKTLSNKIYRSTDGVNWEEVGNIAENYKARLNPVVVVKNNEAYIFGRYAAGTSGNYGDPAGNDKNALFDTYVISLK